MTIKMLINAVEAEEHRIALIKDGLLDGFHIETATSEQRIGNIYKGVVEHINPSIQACFINFGSDKNGFLPSNEIHPEYYLKDSKTSKETQHHDIDKALKRGQELLVQVTKEMPGNKGPQLTTYLSLASRFLVLTLGKTSSGVSKKIEDEKERLRIKTIMGQFEFPEGCGYIVRTAGIKQNKRDFSKDVNRLLRVWKDIRQRVEKAPPYSLIHKEQDVCLRTLRDYFSSDVSEVLVDDKDTYLKVKDYMKIFSPWHKRRIKLYKETRPIFAHYELEKQIETIYSNVVSLKTGGSIVIDPTEALIAIDVNSGRGKMGKNKNIESTAFKTNIEAASEISRQLRLRDIGGLVVIDFIDMKDKKHIREVEKVVREKSRQDRAKIDISHISKFGLLEISRQRLRPSIESKTYRTCTCCQGRGIIPSVESASVSFIRQIGMGVSAKGIMKVKGFLPLEVASYLLNKKRKALAQIENRYGIDIDLVGDPNISPGDGTLEFIKEQT